MYIILFIILAYLLGSIPSALIIGKLTKKIDIREHGSGNMGATNAFRVLGTKAGIIVTLADILKGTIATIPPLLAAIYLDVDVSPLLVGLFAVLGHTYPLFAGFKGGKAAATSAGVILGVSPLMFGIILLIFIIVLYLSKYVSLASMLTGIIASVIAFFISDRFLFFIILALTIFVCIRHKDNIKRIMNKTEPKITWL
ncbi:MAG TPA: glycerol-3-phosphate 1-O-acyltransferase PlsY [Pseudogracilibacillus sp.]|nr:glycerol-3-phosphate 1-O-acyltransferase PlsY [Pseudogracilibacillus sp.]